MGFSIKKKIVYFDKTFYNLFTQGNNYHLGTFASQCLGVLFLGEKVHKQRERFVHAVGTQTEYAIRDLHNGGGLVVWKNTLK